MKKELICIYGCGECGIQTYLLLRENGIHINCFGDRNIDKQGYVIDDLLCRSYEEIIQMDKNILLIVAIAHEEQICSEFKNIGFKKVVYYKNIVTALTLDTPQKTGISDLLDITHLRRLKQDIEKIVYDAQIPIGEKRDYMLHILESWESKKNYEDTTG